MPYLELFTLLLTVTPPPGHLDSFPTVSLLLGVAVSTKEALSVSQHHPLTHSALGDFIVRRERATQSWANATFRFSPNSLAHRTSYTFLRRSRQDVLFISKFVSSNRVFFRCWTGSFRGSAILTHMKF